MPSVSRPNGVDRVIHFVPGPGGQVEGPDLKALGEPGRPFPRSHQLLGGTIEHLHDAGGGAVEDDFGE